MIKIGNTEIADVSLGSTSIGQVYLGNNLIWEKQPAGEWVVLDYLENTSNAYIDTGHKAKNNTTKFECGFIAMETGHLFGARTVSGSSVSKQFAFAPNLGTSTRWDYGSKQQSSSTNLCTLGEYYTVYNDGRILYYSDGTSTYRLTATANTFTCDYNIYLFGVNTTGTITPKMHKISYFKLWENGTLIRDYEPRRQTSTRKYGMYDKVNDVFYTSPNGSLFRGGYLR